MSTIYSSYEIPSSALWEQDNLSNEHFDSKPSVTAPYSLFEQQVLETVQPEFFPLNYDFEADFVPQNPYFPQIFTRYNSEESPLVAALTVPTPQNFDIQGQDTQTQQTQRKRFLPVDPPPTNKRQKTKHSSPQNSSVKKSVVQLPISLDDSVDPKLYQIIFPRRTNFTSFTNHKITVNDLLKCLYGDQPRQVSKTACVLFLMVIQPQTAADIRRLANCQTSQQISQLIEHSSSTLKAITGDDKSCIQRISSSQTYKDSSGHVRKKIYYVINSCNITYEPSLLQSLGIDLSNFGNKA